MIIQQACRTYLDSCVLLAAWRGDHDLSSRAIAVLEDTNRVFVASDFVVLETLAKPIFHKKQDEVLFMQAILDNAQSVPTSKVLTDQALDMACKYNLNALDALHISAALVAGVDEFVTSEKPTKPMFTVKELNVISLYA